MVLLLVVPVILQETVGGNAAWLLLRFLRSFLAPAVFIGHVKRTFKAAGGQKGNA